MRKGTTEELLDDMCAICYAMQALNKQSGKTHFPARDLWNWLGFNEGYGGRKWLYYRLKLLRARKYISVRKITGNNFHYALTKAGASLAGDFV